MRTFIAIELPSVMQEYVRGQRMSLQGYLEEKGVGRSFRWPRVENIHLTLRFLGETKASLCYQLEKDLAVVARAWHTLDLEIGTLGCFPDTRRPTVIWLGVQGELDRLCEMQTQIESVVQSAGFEAEIRGYFPHLTIGRAQRNASRAEVQQAGGVLRQYIDEIGNGLETKGESAGFTVDHFVHMRSDLRAGGSIYTPLAKFSLA